MSYTCLSCQVVFANSQLQREHHKSDWHRYNLKRKVVQLPPVSAESFKNRVLSQRVHDVQTDETKVCHLCHKNFSSTNSFENHLKSKKHIENEKKENDPRTIELRNKKNKLISKAVPSDAAKAPHGNDHPVADDDSDWSSCDDEEEEMDDEEMPNVDTTLCLFCEVQSKSMEQNVEHMSAKHSFFIPDVEYLVDLPGLVEYLEWKVCVGKQCLWCSSPKQASFASEKAVKQHMIDKGHCKVATEDNKILEFADFYDYSSSYPDDPKEEIDEAVELPQLDGDAWQLVLPSGAVIGHRSLKVYYRQNVPEKRVCQKTVNRLVSQYRALGWTGTTGEAAVRKARDIQFMEKIRRKSMLKTGMKHNSVRQKHFRMQVMF